MKVQVLALFWVALLALSGCGGGGGSSVGQDVPQAAGPTGFATLEIRQQIQAQLVPSQVDTVRITGFQSAFVEGVYDAFAGGTPYPPRELPLQPVYVLEDVPVSVDNIRIEYLDAGEVIGLYFQEVELSPGQVFEIVDPAIGTKPEDMNAFSVVALNGDVAFSPPGELPTSFTGEHRGFGMEAIKADSIDLYEYFTAPRDDNFPYFYSDLLRRFMVWSSSNTEVATVSNGSLFNSTNQSGSVKPHSPGTVTITGQFFNLSASVDVRFIGPAPVPEVSISRWDLDPPELDDWSPEGVQRIRVYGWFFDINSSPPQWERDVTAELFYRPSDNPGVADWDPTPGREGHIVRGTQIGEVLLWVRYPTMYEWIAVPVSNT